MSAIEEFAATLPADDQPVLADVRAYAAWQIGRQDADFQPAGTDDVELRNYLLHLRLHRTNPKQMERISQSLQRFYAWANDTGLITANPFADFDFSRPFLAPDQIRRRRDNLPQDPLAQEVSRLRALNELARQLNQAADSRTALEKTLATLVEVMQLQTAWVFLLPALHRHMPHIPAFPPHDFALAAACNLPPGLEMEDKRYLCQPGDCHCQWLLRQGRMRRAVNVVECTRMADAGKAKGDTGGLYYHASVPLIIQDQPVGILNVATEEWQFFTATDLHFLSAVGVQVAVALERSRLFDLVREQQTRMERELSLARDVQAGLLPAQLPRLPGYTLAAQWQSAREVAGDFYDVLPLDDGRVLLLVADVSDKGAHAALYMAMVSSLVRVHASHTTSPAHLLTAVNAHLLQHNTHSMFVTLFLATLYPAEGRLTYASAGHDPQLLRRPDGWVTQLMPTGPLLGILADIELQDETLFLTPGDTLLLYTDGLTDACNPSGTEFGRDRLIEQLQQAPAAASACLQQVWEDVQDFLDTAVPPDDITLLILHAQTPPAD